MLSYISIYLCSMYHTPPVWPMWIDGEHEHVVAKSIIGRLFGRQLKFSARALSFRRLVTNSSMDRPEI